MTERSCPACGSTKGLKDDGSCRNKSACLKRVTSTMVTTRYVGDFDPAQAYRDAPKGQAA